MDQFGLRDLRLVAFDVRNLTAALESVVRSQECFADHLIVDLAKGVGVGAAGSSSLRCWPDQGRIPGQDESAPLDALIASSNSARFLNGLDSWRLDGRLQLGSIFPANASRNRRQGGRAAALRTLRCAKRRIGLLRRRLTWLLLTRLTGRNDALPRLRQFRLGLLQINTLLLRHNGIVGALGLVFLDRRSA